MRDKTLIFQSPNHAQGPMKKNLGPSENDAEALRLWDMDPETSVVRAIIRDKIVQILSNWPVFCTWKHDRRELFVRYIDDVLLQKAESQVHYMNLGTLASRLNDLFKVLLSDGSLAQSYEIAYSVGPSSPDISYPNISSSSGDCVTVSPDTSRTNFSCNSLSTSLFAGGLAASHRYLPNNHRVVANTRATANKKLVHLQEAVQQTMPVISNNCADDRYSVVAPPNECGGCGNGHVFHDVGSNSQSGLPQMASRLPNDFSHVGPSFTTMHGGGAPYEERGINSVPNCNFYSSGASNIRDSSFSPGGNFENMHQSGIHSNWRINSANAPSTCAEMEHMQKDFQLPCQQHYDAYNQTVQHQHYREDLSQQGHLSTDRMSASDQSQIMISGSHQAKGGGVPMLLRDRPEELHFQKKAKYYQQQDRTLCQSKHQRIQDDPNVVNDCSLLKQLSVKPQIVHDLVEQIGPPVEGCRTTLGSVSDSSAAANVKRYGKYHNWLGLYHHALCCLPHERECEHPNCMKSKMLFNHISCCIGNCSIKDCFIHKRLITHYKKCCDSTCAICSPAKVRLGNFLEGTFSPNITEFLASTPTDGSSIELDQPLSKCIRMEHHSFFPTSQDETSEVPVSDVAQTDFSPEVCTQECPNLTNFVKTAPETMELGTGLSSSFSSEGHVDCSRTKLPVTETKLHVESSASSNLTIQPDLENSQVPSEEEVKLQDYSMNTATSAANVIDRKVEKVKKGASLVDSFSPEKIKEHINSLAQLARQSKEKVEQGEGHMTDKNTCSLCGMKQLHFEPPARYCASCGIKILPKGVFYSANSAENESEAETYFCCKCFSVPGDNIKVGGKSISKDNLGRGKNYAQTIDLDEWWVQCDKCKAWQHQICTLFNSVRNEVMQAYHTCPICILQEIENGEHESLRQNKIPGAEDLPTTMLSDHIEQWVFERLNLERQERADSLGKKFSEVPTAECLVVRVVSSVVKKLEVKQAFRDIFGDVYPSDFFYKSKAILLFQNIDGADVCLFGMYVQEYGAGCAEPNKGHVCISYIDSVKYFTPNITAVTGEALRTFVYHEILIGYLDYCKKRGFTSCYIWACPPMKKQDDYILYCHPKMQKMPKPDKLRDWYQSVIRKAVKKEIVVENTNLYDHFFAKAGECKAKFTAARLPYFDGDYWPGQAEVLLQQENAPEKKERKTDRVLRAFRRDALIENPKDIVLMYQLGEVIRPAKENFMVIHLRHICKHCDHPILSQERWVCNVCRNFQLCKTCFLLEQGLEMKDRHPTATSEKHNFQKVQVDHIPADVVDGDGIVQSEIFDTRLMFLSYCQNNRYQFDALRRAKHSTMMILYNLHNPAPPVSVSACIVCHSEMNTSQSWHCISCTGLDICSVCYKKGDFRHEHELVLRPGVTDRDSDNNSLLSNQNKQVKLQKLSPTLVHASECRISRCEYPLCRKIKGLFLHSVKCEIRSAGGCNQCQKIWLIIHVHAQSCVDTKCQVPRCIDVKEHEKKKQLLASKRTLSDSMRRAGAKEQMRERILKQKKPEMLEVCN